MRKGPSIRWRLALSTAALTLLVLSLFAAAIGRITADRVRSDFQNELAAAVDRLADRLRIPEVDADRGPARVGGVNIEVFAASGNAAVRVIGPSDAVLAQTRGAPAFPTDRRTDQAYGFRVETRKRLVRVPGSDLSFPLTVQYARPVSDLERTIREIRIFLVAGVLGGTLLALVGGLLLARRGLRPITDLTATAREIERTGDPERKVPRPATQDEVGELAATLQGMLDALSTSRAQTEAALTRQRQFVADASHELRTPLTAVLANLELLSDVLGGEPGEAARSALRSSRRMKRLVGDLLLLARADADRQLPHERLDLAEVLGDAAAELAVAAGAHELHVDAEPACVEGDRDELHRLVLNLLENAVRHTPDGTAVAASVRRLPDRVRLVVQDEGPGVPAEVRDRLFERFVRGEGDRGGSFGLGLSIVRAVAESHGGTVHLDHRAPQGARFVVELPAAAAGRPSSDLDDDRQHHRAPA